MKSYYSTNEITIYRSTITCLHYTLKCMNWRSAAIYFTVNFLTNQIAETWIIQLLSVVRSYKKGEVVRTYHTSIFLLLLSTPLFNPLSVEKEYIDIGILKMRNIF